VGKICLLALNWVWSRVDFQICCLVAVWIFELHMFLRHYVLVYNNKAFSFKQVEVGRVTLMYLLNFNFLFDIQTFKAHLDF
jgi:hypothetical protein